MTRRVPIYFVLPVLLVLAAVGAVMSLALGSEPLPAHEVRQVVTGWFTGTEAPAAVQTIVTELRAPRTVLALVVGAGLAVAGVVVQALVRNPLADPYLLGVSSGAAVGASTVITTGALAALGGWALTGGAMLGAMGAAALVYAIAVAQGGLSPLRLVLTGVVLSSAFSSVSSLLIFRSDAQGAQAVLHWLLGSLSTAGWGQVWGPLAVVLVIAALLTVLGPSIDVLASGEESARSLGVPVETLRSTLFVLSSLLVGVLVAVSGAVGFVGLVVPHLVRLVVGGRHRVVLPISAVAGGVFLLWVDVVTRVVVPPQELPISVVTGLVGAPIFLVLMGRRQYGYQGQS